MTEYVVPVFFAVRADSPARAHAAVLTALDGIENWDEWMELDHDAGEEVTTVCIGNEDEVTTA